MSRGPTFDPYAVLQVVPTCEPEVIDAAFRALALKYRLDRDATSRVADKMAELNRAYALLREPSARAAFDRARRGTIAGVSVASMASRPSAGPPPTSPAGGSILAFGRYAGWGLRDLARHDPDYLLWLSRHSSGIGYRTEIYSILGGQGRTAA